VAHLLFSRLGLRNIEIVNARTHWISGGSIRIINRAEENFFPKVVKAGCRSRPTFSRKLFVSSDWLPIRTLSRVEIRQPPRSCLSAALPVGRAMDQGPRENKLWIAAVRGITATRYRGKHFRGPWFSSPSRRANHAAMVRLSAAESCIAHDRNARLVAGDGLTCPQNVTT